MSFDISEWKANVSEASFMHTNKYDVFITPNSRMNGMFVNSPSLMDSFRNMGNDLRYRCVGATLPGMVLRTSDNNRMGTGVLEKMPFSAVYTDVDLTFLADRDGAAYMFWYSWLNYIFSAVGKSAPQVVDRITRPANPEKQNREFYTTQYKDNYAAIVDIITYDTSGDKALAYKLYQAFPVYISDSPLSWSDQNNLVKLSVKMTFREWSLEDGQVRLDTATQQNQQLPSTPITK